MSGLSPWPMSKPLLTVGRRRLRVGAAWLEEHHKGTRGVYGLVLAKKGNEASRRASSYDQALEEALCHGLDRWSGQAPGRSGPTGSAFTPRRARSNVVPSATRASWRALQDEGRMRSGGESPRSSGPRADGRWEAAYSGQARHGGPRPTSPPAPEGRGPPAQAHVRDPHKPRTAMRSYSGSATPKRARHAEARRIEQFVAMLAPRRDPPPAEASTA